MSLALALLTSVLASTATSALIIWVLREWISARIRGKIEHEYQRKLEEIRSESAKELSRLNSALQETRDFKATRLRLVYERKISALCHSFEKLAILQQRLGEYVSKWGAPRGPERETARNNFATALQDFEQFFVPNRIFFPSALAEEITDVKNKINNMARTYLWLVESGDVSPAQSSSAWDETSDYAEKKLPKIRRKIEEEIRIELGELPPNS